MGSLKGYEQKLIQHLEKAMENVFQSKLNVTSKNGEDKSNNQL